jgi:hypothetical protein
MEPATLLLILALVAIIIGQSFYIWKQEQLLARARKHPLFDVLILDTDTRAAVISVYEKLCDRLQRAGHLRKDFETVREFEQAILKAVPGARLDLEALDALFEEARYSSHSITPDRTWRALQCLEGVVLELYNIELREQEGVELGAEAGGEVDEEEHRLPPEPEPDFDYQGDEVDTDEREGLEAEEA